MFGRSVGRFGRPTWERLGDMWGVCLDRFGRRLKRLIVLTTNENARKETVDIDQRTKIMLEESCMLTR